MRVKFAVLALIVALGFAGAAQAAPINPFNARPVPVGAAPGSELSLQTILNAVVPGANALTDQSSAAKWTPAPGGSTSAPILRFEEAGNAGSNIVGLWFGTDDTNLLLVDMFLGSATPGTAALMQFINPSTVSIMGGAGVLTNTYTDPRIAGFSFGFYLRHSGGAYTYYSADSANGGTARVLAFEQPGFPSTWAMAFEDGTDFDYNDAVVRIESISAVPEPGSMLLLGSGLVALLARRRRQS